MTDTQTLKGEKMVSTKHRNGDVALRLTPEEASHLWGLIREGRKAHSREWAAYDSSFAFETMQALEKGDIAALNRPHVERFVERFGD